jgi:hypothetical protein
MSQNPDDLKKAIEKELRHFVRIYPLDELMEIIADEFPWIDFSLTRSGEPAPTTKEDVRKFRAGKWPRGKDTPGTIH